MRSFAVVLCYCLGVHEKLLCLAAGTQATWSLLCWQPSLFVFCICKNYQVCAGYNLQVWMSIDSIIDSELVQSMVKLSLNAIIKFSQFWTNFHWRQVQWSKLSLDAFQVWTHFKFWTNSTNPSNSFFEIVLNFFKMKNFASLTILDLFSSK